MLFSIVFFDTIQSNLLIRTPKGQSEVFSITVFAIKSVSFEN